MIKKVRIYNAMINNVDFLSGVNQLLGITLESAPAEFFASQLKLSLKHQHDKCVHLCVCQH